MLNNSLSSGEEKDPYKINLPKFDPAIFSATKKIGSDPRGILLELGLKEGGTMADFGCGVGFFVMEASKIVGNTGKIYAVDIDQKMLDSLKGQALEGGMRNIYGILADLEQPNSTKIEDASCDLVIMINLIYLLGKRDVVIGEAERILKKGGKMAIMEWLEKGQHTMLEKGEHVSLREIKDMARKLDMKLEKSFEAGLAHEVQVFIKK